jgi:molecular chaperone GrpE
MVEKEQIEKNSNTDNIMEQETNAETVETAETNDVQNDTLSADKDAEIAALKHQLEESKDKYLRLFADFDNAKKRHAREHLELIQTAAKGVIVDLLPVVDDFERALKTIETATEVSAVKEGILLIHNKLESTLTAKGLKAIDDLHKEFNVEHHEALTEIPAPTAELEGKVLDVVQKGYLLNDKIIRFAKVVVGKRSEV